MRYNSRNESLKNLRPWYRPVEKINSEEKNMAKARGLSSVQRTLQAMRNQGRICGIVERFNAHVGPFGIRQDLFGIIDIICLSPDMGVAGIQACGQDFKAHQRKILEEKAQESIDWLETKIRCTHCSRLTKATTLELWGWRKVKLRPGAKAMRWKPRVRIFTLDDFK